MITILLSQERYLYDVHSLVKAFYQREELCAEVCADIKGAINRIENNEIPISKKQTAGKDGLEITLYSLDNNDITIIIDMPKAWSAEDASARPDSSETEENTPSRISTDIVNESTNGSDDSVNTPKNLIKQALYGLLSAQTGRTLPWGALTGIRPTKIASGMLADKKDDKTIEDYLKNVHFVSGEKARLSIEIAHRERGVLSRHDYENGYSLYVGIPFCPTRCSYCSFAAYPLKQAGHPSAEQPGYTEYLKTRYASMTDRYLRALEKELAATAELMRGIRLDTVYIGGGTPTALRAVQLAGLLRFLRDRFDFSAVREFTVEAGRPDSILDDIGKLMMMKEYGVDRICVNPQTFSQRTLDRIGRGHTVGQTMEAYHLARDAGFDNINMDIILGLPGERAEDVAHTIEEIKKLGPDDLTVHSLALKRGSRLHGERTGSLPSADSPLQAQKEEAQAADGAFADAVPDAEIAEMSAIAEKGARAMGLVPYYLYRQKNMTGNMENTGFARPGKEGLTNILGMEEVHSIVACGAGAITKRVWNVPEGDPQHGLIRRAGNVKELEAYLARVDEMIERKRALFA